MNKIKSLFSSHSFRASALSMKYRERLPMQALDFAIALFPALFWGVHAYGIRSLAIFSVCVSVSFLCDIIYSLATSGRIHTAFDFSAAVYGALLALFISPKTDIFTAAAFSVVCIVLIKNFISLPLRSPVHPVAAVLSLFSLISMSSSKFVQAFDGTEGASVPALVGSGESGYIKLIDVIFGEISAPIGCSSSLLLLAGGIYLCTRKVIDIKIPIAFIGGICVSCYLLSQNANPFGEISLLALCGQTVFTAFFLCADRRFSPQNQSYTVIYGILCGALAGLLVFKLSPTAAFPISVLVLNTASRIFDLLSRPPKPFGMLVKKK